MGRPPKSTEEHQKNGTYRPSRHDGRGLTLEPVAMLPPPPSLSERAADKWNEIIPAFVSAGLVTVVDAVMLKDAFTHYDIAQDCLDEVNGYESYGAYLRDLDKTRNINLLDSYTEHMNLFHKYMMKFGESPEARFKMRVQPKDNSEDEDLLSKIFGNS